MDFLHTNNSCGERKGYKIPVIVAISITILSLQNFGSFGSTSPKKNENVVTKTSSWIPKTRATACNPKRESMAKESFRSQSKEDRQLMQWFGNLCNGTYIEMGGLDGVLYSNSFAFNKELDWKGVLIEASPESFEKLKVNRKNELATLNAAVCKEERMLHYVNSGNAAVRGFVEFAAPSFAKRYWNEQKIKAAIEIKCRPLKDILLETVGQHFHFDFFSLDIEGAEFEALASLDFDLVSFGIILVESDEHNQLKNMVLRSKLESNGYKFLMDSARSYWFVNSKFEHVYGHLIHS